MKSAAAIWRSILIPALCGGMPIALCAAFAWSSLGVFFSVLGGVLCGALGTILVTKRFAREASAQLRNPELRGPSARALGLYDSLVRESTELLEECEREAADATRGRLELETRSQVRKRQNYQLRAGLEEVEHAVLISDQYDAIQFCNSAARELLFDGPDADGEGAVPTRLDLDSIPVLKELLQQTHSRNAAADHRSAELELTRGAEQTVFRATARNVYDEDNRTLLGVVTTLRDIAREREEKTRHAEFVSSVCHELKTPLAGIRAYTELLIDDEVDTAEERFELYGFIDTQADRLTRLVNNMLNLARIESGVIEVVRTDCELNDVLRKAFDVAQPTTDEKQISLISELSDLYLAAHVDRDLFGQAIINLLSNAVKYTPTGGEVRLRSRMEETHAVIEVRDTGMGIPPDSLPHIFDRFYRVPENNQAAAGTGLGLSLVNYIVTELHNGSISVDSKVGEGTCFTLRIPLGHHPQGLSKPGVSVRPREVIRSCPQP
jgi:two-component system phosphate regulon sensor histidine kinase PhoR